MIQELLSSQYDFRRDPVLYAHKEHAIVILKPDYTDTHIDKVQNFIAFNKLELLHSAERVFGSADTIALYGDIFRFNTNDIIFGYGWKERKLTYMISGSSWIFIVRGYNAQSLCETFKYKMRNEYGKLSVPDKKLSGAEFEELAIKNVIHVVDTEETETVLWLLHTNSL